MMKSILLSIGLSVALLAGALPTEKVEKKVENKSDGLYVGLGGGLTLNGVILSHSDYVSDGSNSYDVNGMGDTSGGFIFYSGYQFNKIIAVEASYSDYGSFSDTLKSKNGLISRDFSSDPFGGAVYANAGYTFDSGWRPFGQLGLGVIKANGSNSLKRLDSFDDTFMTMHYGLGVEYAPESLKGFGLRLAVSGDVSMDASVTASDTDGSIDKSAFMMRLYELFYIGVQYKF